VKRRRVQGMSLMVKLPLTITFVVFASALIIGLMVIDRNWARQSAALEAQTLALARATAATGRSSILKKDVWSLYLALKLLQERDPELPGETPVVEAVFVDTEGMVLAHSNPARNPVGLALRTSDPQTRAWIDYALQVSDAGLVPERLSNENFVDAVAPINVDGLTVGFMLLRSSTAGLAAQLRRDTLTVMTFALGLALVMSLFGAVISRRMVAPLRELAEGLDAVGRGDLISVQPVAARDRDEIGNLSEQFNRMVAELVEKKELEKDLANAERLAGLGRFAAGLAHEVNNPLAGMQNCLNMMARQPDDAKMVLKYVPLLETGLSRISATMQALLGELRGENRARLCKATCLGELESIVHSEIGDRPIDLVWRIGSGDLDGAALNCTCPHMHQIVMNLTRNAINAMPDGGTLTLSSVRTGGRLVLEVSDTGNGIDEKTQSQLFEPFYTTSPSGTGLGLWITYRLITRMGGSIGVDSRPGAGATFTVTLPLSASPAPAADREGKKLDA
jgi:two-component system, NtrC family, sensor kinase